MLASRGVDLRSFDQRRLLDCAMAVITEPLADHPSEREDFIQDNLYAPLAETKEARVKAQTDALAAMGLTPEKVGKFMSSGKEPADS